MRSHLGCLRPASQTRNPSSHFPAPWVVVLLEYTCSFASESMLIATRQSNLIQTGRRVFHAAIAHLAAGCQRARWRPDAWPVQRSLRPTSCSLSAKNWHEGLLPKQVAIPAARRQHTTPTGAVSPGQIETWAAVVCEWGVDWHEQSPLDVSRPAREVHCTAP